MGEWATAKLSRWPAVIVNFAEASIWSRSTGTLEVRVRVVAPAVAVTSWPWTLRYAVTRPYSKRGAKDISIGTLPDKPSTVRSSTAG